MSLLPSATELLYEVGEGERLVGVTLNDNYPPEVALLPKVGDQTIDLEKVLSLEPDIVILDSSFNKDKESLEQLGVAVLELQCKRLADIAPAMRQLGRTFDAEPKADAVARQFTEALKSLEPTREDGVVFIEVWSDPLMTAGGKTLLDDVLKALNLKNCYSDQDGYFQVDPEDVLSRSPDIVIVPQRTDEKKDSRALSLLQKAKLKPRIIKIDPDIFVRPGPRLLRGLTFLQESLSDPH